MYQYTVPERWDEYASLGEVINGTKFVAFKVPLKKEILSAVHKNERFGPEDAIEKIKEKGHVLGLVIDITYTDRYYHQTEFTEKKVEHEHIYCGGHDVPSNAVVYRFFDVVEKFLIKNKNEEMVVGVHCTHGVNRTGYIVCRYMIERLGIDPSKAMEDFNTARGHSIEKKPYIDDLLARKYNPDYVMGIHPPVLKEVKNYNKGNNYSNKQWSGNKTHGRTPNVTAVTEDRQVIKGFQSMTLNNSSHAVGEQEKRKLNEREEKEKVEKKSLRDRGELQRNDDIVSCQGRGSSFTDHRSQAVKQDETGDLEERQDDCGTAGASFCRKEKGPKNRGSPVATRGRDMMRNDRDPPENQTQK
ncbi:RNA/RNP complex-1-interacting phosphatase-like [Mytilus trossulus]|uniref:RNA/RNP complex-1-interacting phosphatase-like n=1 Tax=Mytilus trossulus TaxID=6551 RepID=UPI0030060801